MALQFIMADETVNKKDYIINHLLEIKKSNPQAKMYYLIPDNIKFDMERYVLTKLQELNNSDESAMIDLQVVSFSRLAWFLLPQSKAGSNLSELGVSMLIRQLLKEEENNLIVFRGQVNYQGFIDKLTDLFNELYQGNIEPRDLTAHLEESAELDLNNKRIKELAYLYEKFLNLLDERQLTNYANYQMLLDYIQKGHDFSDYYLVVDQHDFFNSQQLNLILAMAERFKRVWVNLPLSWSDLNSKEIPNHLSEAYKSYQNLAGLCYELGIELLDNIFIEEKTPAYSNDIIQVAKTFVDQTNPFKTIQESNSRLEGGSHYLGQFDLAQTELRAVANEIHYLVSQESYRYKDILILARNLDSYSGFVEPIFQANEIPLFFDQAQTMDQHPFSLLLESLFGLVKYNWDYNNIVNFMKNPLVNIQASSDKEARQHELDFFENIILANGYTGYRFYNEDFSWNFQNQDINYVNHQNQTSNLTNKEVADKIRFNYLNLLKGYLPKKTEIKKGLDWANWLWQILERLGVPDNLEKLRDFAIDDGRIEDSRKHEQVWQTFINLIDEFFELYKGQELDFELFSELILTGLKEGEYHIIPPTIDQVTFQSLDNRRVEPYKVTFVLGLNEGQLPRQSDDDSLLSTEDRELISENLRPQQFLLDFQEMQYSQELLLTYRMLLSAHEKIYLSYSGQDGDKQVNLSPYIQNLDKVYNFPKVSRKIDSSFYKADSLNLHEIGRKKMLIAPVLRTIRESFQNNEQLDSLTLTLITSLNEYGELNFSNLISGIFNFSALPENIQPETAQKLYGKELILSVSRIEKFYQDPYSHFLLHGLRLQEREIFSNDSLSSGNYFHEFMDIFISQIIKSDKALSDYSRDELYDLGQKIIDALIDLPEYQIYSSNPRMVLIREQMDRTLFNLVKLISLQSQKVSFKTELTEAEFGYQKSPKSLQGYSYPLSSGGSLTIRGKIDRLDQIINPKTDERYLQVVDYKSTKRRFNIKDVYYGLDLQLLTYLSVARKNYPDLAVFGGFYQNIIQSYENADRPGIMEASQEIIDEMKLKDNKYEGILLVPGSDLADIEPQIQATNTSLIYPARLKKDGNYYSNVPYYSDSDYNVLDEFVHLKFKEAGELIHSGEIRLRPYYEEQYTNSLRPEYRVITGFDATENYQAYRHKDLKGDAFEAIKEYLQEGGQIDDQN